MNKSNQITNDETINVQRAFWVAIIFTSIAVISFGVGIYLTVTQPYWQIYAMLVIAAFSVVFDVLAVILIRRGRAGTGIKILYWSGIVTLPLNNLLFPGVMPVLVVIILVMGFVNIYLLFPKAWRKYAPFGSIAAALFMLLVDYLNPPFRFSVGVLPTASFFGPAILVFLVVGILVLVVRQAIIGNIRNKLSTSFAVIAILSVVVAGYSVNRFLVSTLTTSIGNNLSELAGARSVDIGRTIDSELKVLKVLALNKVVQDAAVAASQGSPLSQADIDRLDQQWRAADAANNNAEPLVAGVLNNPIASELREFRAQFPQQVELFLTGVQGVSIASTNRTSDYLQSDEEWWQTAYRDGLYIGQPEYDDSSKTIAINMAVAVQQNGKIVGVLRTTVNFTALTDTLVAGLFGETGRTNIYLPDGSELKLSATADGSYDLVQQEAPSDFQTLAQSTQKYQTITINEVPTVASSASVTMPGNTGSDAEIINNLNWRVVTLQDQAEAQQPIAAQTRNSTILAIVLITVVSFAGRGLANVISGPIIRLNAIAEKVATGDLTVEAKVETRDEVGTLAATFNSMTARLREFIGTLEGRVAERTQSLELAAEVGRSVSQVRALDVMLKDAAELIRSRFDLYYVQVYLTDSNQTNLTLQAGTGQVGAELLGRSHRLPLNTSSINGRAAIEKRSVVVADTAASATFKPNPLLPDTRSEMAVPLLIGEKVVGVLDLQSREAGALNQDILTAFEALAGQLAIAIQNATFLAETQQARAEVEAQARRLTRANWADYLDAIHKPEEIGFVFEQNKIAPLTDAEHPELATDGDALAAPIAVTGETLGSLVVEVDDQSRNIRATELVNAVARQVSQQIENLRLLESAERYRAEAEGASRRITREGWKDYTDANTGKGLSYIYDLKEVRPLKAGDGQAEESDVSLPLKVRDETVGKLVIQGLGSDDSEALELANAVAERLGAHIESLRQFDQTQSALAQTEKLSEASLRFARSTDLKELLVVVNETLGIPVVNRTLLGVFNYSSANELESMDIAANWWSGSGHEPTEIGRHYSIETLNVLPLFMSNTPVFSNDTFHDERVNGTSLELVTRQNIRSMAVLPLNFGARQVGVLLLESEEAHDFTQDEIRLFSAMAPQIATVQENLRQFERAQQQAKRESTLNVISQKIQSATTVEAVLQIAARELGHALGAPMTIAQLSMKDKK